MEKILYLTSRIIGIVGVAIITWGFLLSFFRLLKLEFKRFKQQSIYREREAVRHQFGEYILLGLEFLIAADLIDTVIDPNLYDMAVLGSIVAIRTVISYFIEREVAEFRPPSEKKKD